MTIQEFSDTFSDPPPLEEQRIERFAERVVSDLGATMTTLFWSLGARLGLFRALGRGPASSAELSARAGLDERYVREWASGLAAAGYLDHDAASQQFALPAEHAAVLSQEGGPAFLGGAYQVVYELLGVLEPLQHAFEKGGGVALDAYGEGFWHGVQRLTGVGFQNYLVQAWLPAVSGLEARLRKGAVVADVGCGTGIAALELARVFPDSRIVGFDRHAPNVEQARRAARAAALETRVSFEVLDAIEGLPGRYDVVTLFDVVHDGRDPLGLLAAVQRSLNPDGVCLILEVNCGERLEDNRGPTGALLYGLSLMHCMTQSLASGGAGLGTCGLPEPKLRALSLEAGFLDLERVWDGPMDVLYSARCA